MMNEIGLCRLFYDGYRLGEVIRLRAMMRGIRFLILESWGYGDRGVVILGFW